ncbi:MAG: hypothetical protein SVM80_01050 [Halobacteriota archaeon]|nr:hypothetical protein [Halobacteriota archaeon]
MRLLKTWFGVFGVDEKGKVLEYKLFPEEEILNRVLSGEGAESIEVKRLSGLNLVDLAIGSGFVASEKDYFKILHKIGIDLAKQRIEASFTEDRVIIQAIKTLDDLDEMTNLFSERLGDWGFLHPFVGVNELLEVLAVSRLNLEEDRDLLEAFIEEKMLNIAPNMTNLAGPLLGARIISLAGGLNDLAKMPSSTIQVLGAGKSLFRHLQKGTPPPKHGIIFRHPLVHTAPSWQRGKIARVFSSKLSIAARIDHYSGRLNEDLKKDLQRRVEEIRLAYPKEPKGRVGSE